MSHAFCFTLSLSRSLHDIATSGTPSSFPIHDCLRAGGGRTAVEAIPPLFAAAFVLLVAYSCPVMGSILDPGYRFLPCQFPALFCRVFGVTYRSLTGHALPLASVIARNTSWRSGPSYRLSSCWYGSMCHSAGLGHELLIPSLPP